MAILAVKPEALVILGHLACAFQDPADGLFYFASMGLTPTELDTNKKYTWTELKELLTEKRYTSYKAFYVDNPQVDATINTENEVARESYNLFASGQIISDDIGQNCLTAAKKILRAYGVDLPDPDLLNPIPNAYFLSIPEKIYYPDNLGDDPFVPTGYLQSSPPVDLQPTAAADMLSVGTPQSNVIWQETSPTDTSKSNAQGTAQTTSQSINTKFSIGAKVEVTDSLNVRNAPGTSSGTITSTKTAGSTATVLSGPYYADGFTWWELQYDDGTRGWSQEKRLESESTIQQPVTQQAPQSTGYEPIVVSGYKPTYYPPGTTYNNLEPVQLSPIANYQKTANQPVDQRAITEQAVQLSSSDELQPATSKYTSLIPSEDTQFIQDVSPAGPLPGQVQVELDLRNENGEPAPPGTAITVKDGSGNYVQVNWDSNGHALAYGAPGTWIITANALGYATNTGYTVESFDLERVD